MAVEDDQSARETLASKESAESQCTRDLPVNLLLSDRQKIKKDRQADDSATIMTFGLQ
jgi:hypothetical protein